jgi:hypothetical protein
MSGKPNGHDTRYRVHGGRSRLRAPSSSICSSGASVAHKRFSATLRHPVALTLVRAFRLSAAESEKPVQFVRSARDFTARISTVLII